MCRGQGWSPRDRAIRFVRHRFDPATRASHLRGLHGFSFPLMFTWEGLVGAGGGGGAATVVQEHHHPGMPGCRSRWSGACSPWQAPGWRWPVR